MTKRAVIYARTSTVDQHTQNQIVERVKSGMRRARLEGRRIGRPAVSLDRETLRRDRERGLSFGELAELHHVSKTTVIRALKESATAGLLLLMLAIQPVEDSERLLRHSPAQCSAESGPDW
jgi:DNA invertase Pin-like site-specific DNA recombinase